jgi:hypothetical protein
MPFLTGFRWVDKRDPQTRQHLAQGGLVGRAGNRDGEFELNADPPVWRPW